MNLFSAEYNKKNNQFEQGVSRIRNKNNNFFENTKLKTSAYDLTDIKSYFSIDINIEEPTIRFRTNNSLPPTIEKELRELFNGIWNAPKPA